MKNGEKSFGRLFELVEILAQTHNGMTGKTLAGEVDLEGMYHYNRNSPAFFLNDLKLPKMYTKESRELIESTEVVNG